MSLFGEPEADESPSMTSSFARSRQSLFDEEESNNPSNSNSIFQDDDVAGSRTGSPWDIPTPRKQHSRADLVRNLLPASDVPDSYIETFDSVVREDGSAGKVTSGGVMRVLAAAKIGADDQARIMGIIAPGGGEVALGRNEFSVLLGLIGLAQDHETLSLDGIDERRRSEFTPTLLCPALPCSACSACSLSLPMHQSIINPHLPTSSAQAPVPRSATSITRPLSLICDRHWHHVLQVDALSARLCCQLARPPPYPSQKSQSSCGAPHAPAVCPALPYLTTRILRARAFIARRVLSHRHTANSPISSY